MGLGHRWAEVESTYAEVNLLFGDIVKVTPSSKVVGDMTLFLMAKGYEASRIAEPGRGARSGGSELRGGHVQRIAGDAAWRLAAQVAENHSARRRASQGAAGE